MPFSPDQVADRKSKEIPDYVFDVWDTLIATAWNGSTARVVQNVAIEALLKHTASGDRKEVFDKGWLDIEEIYRAVGWKVHYDKPGYNETYDAYFVFKK